MKVRYNGHSCFSVFADDGKCIVIDPYESGAYGGAIAYHPVDSEPDVVVLSHDHPDHSHTEQFKSDFKVVRGPGEAKGFKFDVVNTFHDQSQGADRGKNRIFLFEVDGVRVGHMGDLGHLLSDEQIKAVGAVDVMMLPVGGFYTIDANEATDVVERTRPKIAIPMHYKTDKCGFDIAPVDDFVEGKNNVIKLGTDEIELSSDKLPGETEIIVLKHRL
ncbi:MAG: MBL fold metallo-hydrolase [Deltaproteobacteria bacterium]|nr:MBL fold metallo-hydrolase [Deltaproteobacteria bacterium]